MIDRFQLKDMDSTSDFPFHMGFFTLTGDFPEHGHDFVELLIILKGKAIHRIGDEEYKVSAGDVYVMRRNMTHELTDASSLEQCNIMFHPEKMNLPMQEMSKLHGFNSLFVLEPFYRKKHGFNSRLHLDVDAMNRITPLLYAMSSEYDLKSQGYEANIRAFLTQLIITLSREYEKASAPGVQHLFRIAKAISYMESHFDQPLSISELAKRADMSERHFNRLFKTNYKVSPSEYLIRLRVQRAIELLGDSSRSITEVAFDSGFNDSNYFSRKFKQIMGSSPREYRRDMKDS